MAVKATKTGLFPVCFEIGGQMLDAPLFKTNFLVYTPAKAVSGFGEITWAVSPPLDVKTKLDGSYTYMTVMPRNVHILVVVHGCLPVVWRPHGGMGPVVPPNVELRMVLTEDWRSGTASYKYLDDKGNWHEVGGALVKVVPCWRE